MQLLESPDLSDAVVDAVFANQDSPNAIADYIASGHADAHKVIIEVGAMIHATVATQPNAPAS